MLNTSEGKLGRFISCVPDFNPTEHSEMGIAKKKIKNTARRHWPKKFAIPVTTQPNL
jgi:hypothetical protein